MHRFILLALLIAAKSGLPFVRVPAPEAGLAELRKRIKGRRILILDELHRFSKAQQDFFLPILETGEIIEARWKQWLKHDPVHMVRDHRKALKSLKGICIDCGWRDQYHIHYGTRQLSRALHRAGVPHRYEEFDDDHSSVDYRMDESLPWLYRKIMGRSKG